MLTPITETKLLVVEGKDEVYFFEALKTHLGLTGIKIRDCEGKENMRPFIKALPKTPGFNGLISLGLIRDADTDAQSAFQSVCDALKDADLAVPSEPSVFTGDSPRVIIMILPNGFDPGMLENLCLDSVVDDPAMTCVDEYFECLKKKYGKLPGKMPKAKVHAFLVSREEPDKRLGEAAKAGYWPWDSQAFEQVKQLLNTL